MTSMSLEQLQRALEYLVPPGADTGERRPNDDVRLQPLALQLTTIGVANVMAGERRVHPAHERHRRHVAVCAHRRGTDDRRLVRCLEEQPRMLGLTDRAL